MIKNLRLLILFALLFFTHEQAFAENISKGPKVSSIFPDFSATTMNGGSFELSKYLEEGTVVVIMLRGYPGAQCPVCSTQVAGFIAKAEEFENQDTPVVFVYPGHVKNLDKKAKEFTAPLENEEDLPSNFIFVIDNDYTITNLLGLRWNKPKETAYPAAFVIDHKSYVQYANVSDSHQGRATPDDILEVLEIIN